MYIYYMDIEPQVPVQVSSSTVPMAISEVPMGSMKADPKR